ncbi:MAG TPA: intein-containing Rv2578c family radical SAM protein [Pseudonocardia sp.]|uniref:intein-containing Rv2578c family radical SAM protein n=1 Tax=Pseudonocardia sp. TaxID=60912 RepID=UPI002B8CEC32|nr:intein-containing Rv2578c family radical SAM protein [Pseudonocardia sp.]HTF53849.1 intein-containing Rv2578c family radical SAM protein [Pseudonocardia sp.]
MRWGSQEVLADGVGADAVLPGMRGLLRTVRAPEFAGIVFHEVEARSALNKVPGGPLPFGWTVNPYRGCSHACTYCLVGDTPVLLADGRRRQLARLRVGDEIYGTRGRGRHRRYVRTTVLAHWSTVKPAYRVHLADGTELVGSGEHRFLTGRGWRHVAPGHGWAGRPHLSVGDTLLGTGRFVGGPEDGESYRRGYLCGMVRGGGPIGARSGYRSGRVLGAVPRFRLAVVDLEALRRTRRYLASHGVRTDELAAVGAAPGSSVESWSSAGSPAAGLLARWPTVPDDDWYRGFLAGVFDAEGESSAGVVRIFHADQEVVRRVGDGLRRLGFRWAEERARADGAGGVRLLGGQLERLRFCHAVDPAVSRKRSLDGEEVRAEGARLEVAAIEPLGVELPMYDITTGTGDFIADGVVSHNCFARNTHTYLDFDAGEDFNRQVVVKVNVARVLERELRSARWRRDHVAMGTNTDPYQRAEGRYRLMPGVITALARSGTPFSVLTKGTLLARDLPLLSSVSSDVSVGLGVSIALSDRELQASLEPGTPTPAARLELVRRITDAGLSCGVMVAPVLPLLTDSAEALDDLLGQIAGAGASGATVLALHLRPGTREWFLAWLAREHPSLLEPYRRLYARGAYVDKRYREALGERVAPLLRRHGLVRKTARQAVPGDAEASLPSGVVGPGNADPGGEQLALL